MVTLGFVLSRMKTRNAAQTLRVALGVGGVIIGAILTLRGAPAAGVPLVGAALGLLGVAMGGGSAESGSDQSGENAVRSSRTAMSRREASEILGVSETASDDEINAAYRNMMKRVHPDAGGSDALAARVQEARNTLLGKT